MAQHLGTSQSSQNLRASYVYHPHRLPGSARSTSLLLPHSASFQSFGYGSRARSSGTWTTSSGELGLLNNADEVEDRDVFVQEYNRLAKKHGVRPLVTEEFEARHRGEVEGCPEKRGWISRLLHPTRRQDTSHAPVAPPPPPPPQIRHKRSVSELANIIHCKREAPRIMEIQEMVRLGGRSILYLPQEYSPCYLILPTCIRATAQYLAQNVATRGLFRVPGSSKVISALFDYYCHMDNSNAKIASTVRCATLPMHIQYSTHDVASTFKRLLSVLPGGVLGSLSLLDALIAIHSQLNGEPEYPRTKQTKVRARLIALAIGTVRSQHRRELICAVFGLLSLIGRAAEIAPREDEDSRPLPTGDLMGYSALGIVFGPLLVGDLLDQYTMKAAAPASGMPLFPLSPTRFRKDRRKSFHMDCKGGGPPTVDRILVANDLTKMLISNWRDVVRQMKSLGTHCRKDASTIDFLPDKQETLHPAQVFNNEAPKEFNEGNGDLDLPCNSLQEPKPRLEPETPTRGPKTRRLKVLRRADSQRLMRKMSVATLSPTKEESLGDDEYSDRQGTRESVIERLQKLEKMGGQSHGGGTEGGANCRSKPNGQNFRDVDFVGRRASCAASRAASSFGVKESTGKSPRVVSQVYLESIPPRESSRQASSHEDTRDSLSKNVLPEQITTPAVDPNRRESSIVAPDTKQAQRGDTNGRQASDVSSAQKRSEGSSMASTSTKPLSEGGIRLVQASPVRAAVRPEKTDRGPEFVEPVAASKLKLFISHDQGVQCQILTEPERRQSIDSTPERFYPFPRMSQDAPPVTFDKSLLLSNRPGAKKPQKRPVLLLGPRLSKSDENLTSQTCITLQSPTTESTEPQELAKKGSVRAMAALFELQPGWRESAANIADSRARSPRRSRHSKSDSAWTQNLDPLADLIQDENEGENLQDLSLQGNTPEICKKDEFFGLSHGSELKSVPSLGTMVPCPEQPPIAQHLNLARPPSSSSPTAESKPYSAPEMVSTLPLSRAGSATVLYSQIGKLHRQLNAKTEEAAQLRRQMDVQKDSDIGTLSEQLRQAKRDVAAWKDRAEAAERRVKVFETFTEKLREIRDAIAETKLQKQAGVAAGVTPLDTGLGGQGGESAAAAAAAAKVVESIRVMQQSREEDARKDVSQRSVASAIGLPEAEGRERRQGVARTQDGADSQDSQGEESVTGEEHSCEHHCEGGLCLCELSSCSSFSRDGLGPFWVMLEELLRIEEEGRAGET
ncbi:hypothetical protein E4U17_005923 [Claviceps sp. LM77 group G4]|nr:hypothetical protein E4U17_005923 [Claviceps sp. LM77 group G4]KAG6080651.1 hypothetical protein E4U33_007450 [Claviceps sp. LM78 group G4]KAG6081074.1 hypothetical protein E4U16_007862 [Claviceps sp. LM84 group G4]